MASAKGSLSRNRINEEGWGLKMNTVNQKKRTFFTPFLLFVLWIAVLFILPISSHASSTLNNAVKTQSIVVQSMPIDYTVHQKKVIPALGDQGFMCNNRIYVPLRFIGQSLKKKCGLER